MGMKMIEAATELYAAEGPEGVSLRKLGARLGISPSGLYKHFSSRARLLDAVAGNAHVELLGYFDRHRRVEPARAQLGAITSDALDFALASPRLFKLMYDDARRPSVSHDAVLRRATMLIERVAREEPGMLADPIHPRQIAQGWLSLIVGAAAMHRARLMDEETLRRMCDRSAGRVLGLA
jgi:AcrR family transcriptional regulator